MDKGRYVQVTAYVTVRLVVVSTEKLSLSAVASNVMVYSPSASHVNVLAELVLDSDERLRHVAATVCGDVLVGVV